MKRTAAIALVALGTILFGVAVGLVYLDDRALRVRRIEFLETYGVNPPPTAPEPKADETMPLLLAAMAIGPLGAGLGLAGLLMLLSELPWFRRGHDPRTPADN